MRKLTNEEIGKQLKMWRVERDWKQRDVSERAGVDKDGLPNISVGMVGMIENGKRRPSDKMKDILANVFGVSPFQIEYADGDVKVFHSNAIAALRKKMEELPGMETYDYRPSHTMIPIVGRVRCGVGGLAYEDLQGSAMADVGNPSEYFYLRAEGDSMAPKITDGDLVLIHRQEEVENGELAVVIIDGEEGTLKKFQRKDGAVILQSLNPNYPPRVFIGEEMKNVYIAGKAVELKRVL